MSFFYPELYDLYTTGIFATDIAFAEAADLHLNVKEVAQLLLAKEIDDKQSQYKELIKSKNPFKKLYGLSLYNPQLQHMSHLQLEKFKQRINKATSQVFTNRDIDQTLLRAIIAHKKYVALWIKKGDEYMKSGNATKAQKAQNHFELAEKMYTIALDEASPQSGIDQQKQFSRDSLPISIKFQQARAARGLGRATEAIQLTPIPESPKMDPIENYVLRGDKQYELAEKAQEEFMNAHYEMAAKWYFCALQAMSLDEEDPSIRMKYDTVLAALSERGIIFQPPTPKTEKS